jgi:hypothetical protein
MSPITLLDNRYVTLWFHPESRIVHHVMHRFVPIAAMRQLLQTGAEAMAAHRGCKWLSDDRKGPVVDAPRIAWARENWMPRLIETGFRYWAVVPSEAALGRWGMERAIEEYRAVGVEVCSFTTPEAAIQWLQAQPS